MQEKSKKGQDLPFFMSTFSLGNKKQNRYNNSDTKEKTFYDITNEWLLYKRHQVKESTYRLYQYRIMKYLQKYFDKKC